MNEKTVVVLGGGVGGIVAANELRRLLPAWHRVVLIEKNPVHAFAPSFLWLMTGDRKPEKITVPLDNLVRLGVEVIHAAADKLDIPGRCVTTSSQTVRYDFLVLAVGAELAPEMVPGLAGSAYSFYSFDEAQKLQTALGAFTGGRIAVMVCSLPYKCPGAPHEGAMLIADSMRRRGLQGKTEVHLFTPEPQPMPVAGPELGEAVKQMLASKGVAFHPLHKPISVNPETHEVLFDGKGPVRYDLLVAIPPHRGPDIVLEAGLANEAGWVPVDRATLKTRIDNVYAVGDITAIAIPGRWKPDVPMMLPKAGVFAHVQAEIVAERIADEINGRRTQAQFCGEGYCMLEAGEDLAGFAFGDFFAEPSPRLELRNIGKAWHLGKVLFEQWWLSPFGIRKSLLGFMLSLGARILRIPVKI